MHRSSRTTSRATSTRAEPWKSARGASHAGCNAQCRPRRAVVEEDGIWYLLRAGQRKTIAAPPASRRRNAAGFFLSPRVRAWRDAHPASFDLPAATRTRCVGVHRTQAAVRRDRDTVCVWRFEIPAVMCASAVCVGMCCVAVCRRRKICNRLLLVSSFQPVTKLFAINALTRNLTKFYSHTNMAGILREAT